MRYRTQIARKLRQEQTQAEQHLWEYLRNRNFRGLKFRRQHPLKQYIVDFFCHSHGIIIELDGGYHKRGDVAKQDYARDFHLKELGYKVLRYRNHMVYNEPHHILNDLERAVRQQKKYAQHKKQTTLTPNPSPEGRGESPTILSTKTLSQSDRERLLQAGVRLVSYDAISITPLDFQSAKVIPHAIVTSKNAARLVLEKGIEVGNWYCVGDKTEAILIEKGQQVVEKAQNAFDLAQRIIKGHHQNRLVFFCGQSRRNELPYELTKTQIPFEEIVVYRTQLIPKKFNQTFYGILFYSPSGVRSFTTENRLESPTFAFCIGQTTAQEAKKYTDKIIVAKQSTVSHTVASTAQHIRNTSTWN